MGQGFIVVGLSKKKRGPGSRATRALGTYGVSLLGALDSLGAFDSLDALEAVRLDVSVVLGGLSALSALGSFKSFYAFKTHVFLLSLSTALHPTRRGTNRESSLLPFNFASQNDMLPA